jgi:hypothetical protein
VQLAAARMSVLLISTLFVALAHGKEGTQVPNLKIKQRVIEESIASYPGNCPCPYNVTRNGSSCGGRSAWSRRGGYAPICYDRQRSGYVVSDGSAAAEFTSDSRAARLPARSVNFSKPVSPTCYTGPRGGTYTITSSGRKNYSGC